MRRSILWTIIAEKGLVCALFSMFFLCTVFYAANAEAASVEATKVAMSFSRMQKLVYADIEIALTAEEKNAIKNALLSDKILPEDPDELGSQPYSEVTLQDNNKSRLIIGTTGTDKNVVIMKSNGSNFSFDITPKNLSKTVETAEKIANEAFKNKTTNLDAVISSFAFLVNSNAEDGKPLALTAQDRNDLPKLLLTNAWRFTNNFNYKNEKTFDIKFIRSSEDLDGTTMSFKISNGLYFVSLSFYNDFEAITFEVPKQTFSNLGLQ